MAQPLLVARDAPLARCDALLDRVSSTTGQAAVVEGTPGIGKTSLTQAVVERAARRGFTAHVGRARELDVHLQFAPFADALGLHPTASDPRRAALGDLLRGDADVSIDADQRRWQLIGGIVDVVEQQAQEAPTLLVIEDAHWLDPGSAIAVSRLTSLLDSMSLGILLTTRPDPRPAHLAAAMRQLDAAGAEHVVLAELDPDAVMLLAQELLGAAPGPRLRHALERAAGNPLFVTELVDAYRDEGVISVDDGEAELTADVLPTSLRLTIVRRLGYLPAETLEVLRVAAVLGTSCPPDRLAAVVGCDEAELVGPLEPGYASGLLVVAGDEVAFRHALIRDALYDDLPGATRAVLHATAAETLRSAGAPPDEVATHIALSLLPGDHDRSRLLLDAAAALVEAAPALAEAHARQVFEMLPPGDPDRLRARTVSARATVRLGRPEEAEALAQELGNDALDDADRLELYRTVNLARYLRGDVDHPSLEAYRQLARSASVAPSERVRHLAVHALLARADDPEETEELLSEARDPEARALLLVASGTAALVHGRMLEAKERTAAAVAVVRAAGLQGTWVGIEALSAFGLPRAPSAADAPAAADALREALLAAETGGLLYAVPRLHVELARTAWFLGDHDTAVLHDETALRTMAETGYRAYEPLARAHLASIALSRGRPDVAAEHNRLITEFEADKPHPAGMHTEIEGRLARASRHIEQGAWEEGWDLASAAADDLRRLGRRGFTLHIWTLPYVVAAVGSGQPKEAEEWAARLEQLSRRAGMVAPMAAVAASARAVVDRTLASARAAVAPLRAAGVFPIRLEGFFLVAEVLAERDARDEAVELLTEGRQLADRAGAVVIVGRYDAALRELGVRRGAVGAGSRPGTGWEALTEAEWRVVDLVADGLIYREVAEALFVSRRTVETHVANIFRKIGVNSRNALTRDYLDRARSGRPDPG